MKVNEDLKDLELLFRAMAVKIRKMTNGKIRLEQSGNSVKLSNKNWHSRTIDLLRNKSNGNTRGIREK